MAYTTRAKLEARFGARNISAWADKDGEEDEDVIDAAITAAITDAEGEVDAILRGGLYKVPFTDTIPVLVSKAATVIAAEVLFTGRGVIDTQDGESNVIGDLASEQRTLLHQIKTGRVLLEVATDYGSGPVAVSD